MMLRCSGMPGLDPEPTFMTLALLLPIGQIADIDRERHDDSR